MRRMEEAAPQAAQEDVEQALGYLRLLWGDEFEIGHDAQGFWARPTGQPDADLLRAATAEDLGGKMNSWSAP